MPARRTAKAPTAAQAQWIEDHTTLAACMTEAQN
jgi:hypothetical protein